MHLFVVCYQRGCTAGGGCHCRFPACCPSNALTSFLSSFSHFCSEKDCPVDMLEPLLTPPLTELSPHIPPLVATFCPAAKRTAPSTCWSLLLSSSPAAFFLPILSSFDLFISLILSAAKRTAPSTCWSWPTRARRSSSLRGSRAAPALRCCTETAPAPRVRLKGGACVWLGWSVYAHDCLRCFWRATGQTPTAAPLHAPTNLQADPSAD